MIARSIESNEAFPPELPLIRRYTLAGEPAMEHQVQQDLSRLSADAELSLSGRLRSLLLIGRFARGEGSIVECDGEPIAYGGYQCLAVADRLGNNTLLSLRTMERTWSGHLRVPVRIHPCLSQTFVKRHNSLWWLDVGRGNVELLSGNPAALTALQSVNLRALHKDEVGWLLTEQATLLALALNDASTPALLRRHRLHTMALACGDAALLLEGRFSGGLRARLGQLKTLAPGSRAAYYADAVTFLTRPDLFHIGDEASWQQKALRDLAAWHMALERQRCGAPEKLASYVRHRGDLFERHRHGNVLRQGLDAAAHLWRAPLSFPYVQEPRERLARVASGLAYGRQDASIQLICMRLLDLPGRPTANDAPKLLSRLFSLLEAARRRRGDPTDVDFYA